MKLTKLIAIANRNYGLRTEIAQAYRSNDPLGAGDTLALFVTRELAATFDEEATDYDQLTEGVRLLDMAIDDLMNVKVAFEQKLNRITMKGGDHAGM